MALVKCVTDGCNAKVVVGQNEKCSHCRPRPPRSGEWKAYDSPERRRKAKAARRRRRDSAGVPSSWL